MKKLLKHISPLAPDNSGAVGVLYELGGIVVICDAGGCAGNVCGFDEPRWFEKRSALFSAGLRDMDAILGRDDRLAHKLAKAAEQIKAEFTAIIGTPVPAVIATDYKALSKLSERKTGIPCIAVETTGTKLYDKGEQAAYLQLFKTFANDPLPVRKGKIGVIGATPLNISETNADRIISELKSKGWEYPVCYGMGSGLDEVKKAGECEKNLVISPSGIKAAEYLKEKFGTPYEVGFFVPPEITHKLSGIESKKVLIIGQQFAANALRSFLSSCQCDCASWFMTGSEYMCATDFCISDEEELAEKVEKGGYDVIIADKALKSAVSFFKGEFIDYPHFAVSGRLLSEGSDRDKKR